MFSKIKEWALKRKMYEFETSNFKFAIDCPDNYVGWIKLSIELILFAVVLKTILIILT